MKKFFFFFLTVIISDQGHVGYSESISSLRVWRCGLQIKACSLLVIVTLRLHFSKSQFSHLWNEMIGVD